MDKLLHERLREFATSDYAIDLRALVNAKSASTVHIAEAIADEIERYYFPRPCVDGEPIKLNDEVGWLDALKAVLMYANNEKKVLDADGVEINVGDTVYHIKDGACDNVISLETDEYGQPMANCLSFEAHAKHVTHEKPVFDADGVRICKGDTVWIASDHACVPQYGKHEVLDINDKYVWVSSNGIYYDRHGVYAEYLTHREPETIEGLHCLIRDYSVRTELSSEARDGLAEIEKYAAAIIERESNG